MKKNMGFIMLFVACAVFMVWQQASIRRLRQEAARPRAPLENAPTESPHTPPEPAANISPNISPEPPAPSEPPREAKPNMWRRASSQDVDTFSSGEDVFGISFDAHSSRQENSIPTLDSLREALVVEPAVSNLLVSARTIGTRWANFNVSGGFAPGTLHTFTFRKDPGMFALDGSRVPQDEDWVFVLESPRLQPSARLDVTGRYFAPKGKMLLPVKSLATAEFTVEVTRLPPHNIVNAARNERDSWAGSWQGAWVENLTAATTSITFRVTAPPSEARRHHVGLGNFLDAKDNRGVYLVRARVNDPAHWGNARLIAVTDIGLGAVLHENTAEVCALSLSTALPLGDTALELFSVNGTLLGRGATDENGTASLSFARASQTTEEPMVLVATRADDQSFLLFHEKNAVDMPFISSRRYLREGAHEAFVFTERGIYRPGETVFLQGLVRGRDGLPPQEKFPVFVTLVDPARQKQKPRVATPDDTGAFSLELTLPESGRQGRYEILVSHAPNNEEPMGRASVSMESFVPPTVRVDLAEIEWLDDAQTLVIPARADFLFGAPGRNLPANATLTARDAPFAPRNWEAFAFGNPEAGAFSEKPEKITGATTDENGALRFAFQRPPLPGRGALRLFADVEVTEPSGRPAVEIRAYDFPACYDAYLGCKKTPAVLPPGAAQPLEFAVVGSADFAARDTAGWQWRATLKQVNQYWMIKENQNGWWTWEETRHVETLRDDRNLVAPPSELPQLPPGDYVLVVEKEPDENDDAPNACCAVSLSWQVTGAATTANRASPEKIEIFADKKQYAPGDVAVFDIRVPFEGAKSAWVTLQNHALVEQFVLPVEGASARLAFTLAPEHAPGLTVLASAVHPARAENEWGSHRAFGALSFAVVPENTALEIALTCDDTAEPSQDYHVKIAVRDEHGDAVPNARVTLLLVEDGILRLTDYKTPNPFDFFFALRQPALEWHDVYRALIPLADETRAVEASRMGGDSEDLSELGRRLNPIKARRFNPLIRWQTDLRTGTDGTLTAWLPVHEVATGARVMAVTWTQNQYGCAEKPVAFKRDVAVLLDGPRFMALGDEAEGTISLHNTTDEAKAIVLEYATHIRNRSRMTTDAFITMKPNASETITYNIRATDVGIINVEIAVKPVIGDETAPFHDDVILGDKYTLSYELPIRPASGLQTHTTYHTVAPGGTLELPALPEDEFLTAASRRTLSAFGNPVADLTGALDYLASYPYGCLEQTISRAFPLMTWPDALAAMPAQQSAAESRVRAGITRALSLWRGDGFSPWPQHNGYHTATTLYALEFFASAREAGYDVPDGMFNNAVETVKRWAREMKPDDADLPYACHVLATAGSPDFGRMAQCRENLDALSIENRVHVAAAFLAAGNAQACREIMAELPFPENDLDAAARLLMLHAQLAPDSVTGPRLVHLLQRNLRKSGHWGTTSGNALMTRALGLWHASQPATSGAFNLSITAPGVSATSGATNLFTFAVNENLSRFALSNTGDAPAHLAVKTEAIPVRGLPAEEDHGITLRRAGDLVDDTLARGDIATFTLTLDTRGARIEDIVLDIPLPAGLEPHGTPVVKNALQVEKRDDRFLIFLQPVRGVVTMEYAAMAVSPGVFVHPPATAAAMYDPDLYSVSGSGKIIVR